MHKKDTRKDCDKRDNNNNNNNNNNDDDDDSYSQHLHKNRLLTSVDKIYSIYSARKKKHYAW